MVYMAAVFASVLSVLSVTSASKPCCTPDQWEGQQAFTIGSVTKGNPTVTKGFAFVSFDAKNKRVAANETIYVSGKKPTNVKVIQNFNKHIQYNIYAEGGKWKCLPTKLGEWIPACVPDNATFLGNSYYGAGSDTLRTSTFSYSVTGMNGYLIMTEKACVPVGESITGNVKGSAFMAGIGYQGFTEGIKDPSVFKVPDICSHVTPIKEIASGVDVLRLRRTVF